MAFHRVKSLVNVPPMNNNGNPYRNPSMFNNGFASPPPFIFIVIIVIRVRRLFVQIIRITIIRCRKNRIYFKHFHRCPLQMDTIKIWNIIHSNRRSHLIIICGQAMVNKRFHGNRSTPMQVNHLYLNKKNEEPRLFSLFL